jgi:hypothetical protein
VTTSLDRLSFSSLAPSLTEAMRADVASANVTIHDPSRLEWSVTVPTPTTSTLRYEIQAELEVPTRFYVEHRPWSKLQALARLDWPEAGPRSKLAEVDVLRREVLDVDGKLLRACEGFRHHCLAVAHGENSDLATSPLSVWLDVGVTAIADVRQRLLGAREKDTTLLARERVLADEFLSVRALGMLTSMTEHLEECPPSPAIADAASELRRAHDEELSYRASRGFAAVDPRSPESLEAHVTRANALKKHFESLLYLRRETKHLDVRMQPWIAGLAALLAGSGVFLLQLFATQANDRAAHLRSGVVLLAVAFGILYAGRDRLKVLAERWLATGLQRLTAQRLTRLLSPLEPNLVIARAKESFEEGRLAEPDALDPELGGVDPATLVRFVHAGELYSHSGKTGLRPRALRLLFRYDLSPVFARLDDPKKLVAVADPSSDRLRLVTASRTYRITFRLRLKTGARIEEQRYQIVLDKRGLLRLEITP